MSAAQPAATPLMDRLVARTMGQHVPLSVHFDLTYRCNERCVHCYLDHQDHGELTTGECLEILEQLAQSGTLFLTFSGGEIFLRKDLEEILACARRLHFDVSLKTNALLITPSRAAKLASLGVRRVQISVYSSNPAIHDSVTKVPGSLERTLAAIPLLLEHGIRVKLACPLMKQNLLAYRGVMALAERLGIPYVLDLTITPMMDGSHGPLEHRASASELLPVLRDATLSACSVSARQETELAPVLGSGISSGIERGAYEDVPCSAGHNSCYISPYGDVYACVQLPVPAGNLRRQRFAEIWSGSSALQKVRLMRESELSVCSRCEIRVFCERCPGLAWMEGGDLMAPYQRACELAEERARLAGIRNPVSAWRAQMGAPAEKRLAVRPGDTIQ